MHIKEIQIRNGFFKMSLFLSGILSLRSEKSSVSPRRFGSQTHDPLFSFSPFFSFLKQKTVGASRRFFASVPFAFDSVRFCLDPGPGANMGQNCCCFFRISPQLCQTPFKIPGYTILKSKNKPLSFWISSLPGAKDVAVFWQADKQFSPLAEFIIDKKGSPPIRKGCPFLRSFLQQRLHLLDHPLFQINQPISYLSGRSVRLGILVEVFV